MSSVLTVNPPPVPVLATPLNGAINLSDINNLTWFYPDLATSYRLQISRDPSFASDTLYDQIGLMDTTQTITGLEGGTTFYWRV